MATDKALPNEVRKEINIPNIEDIQVELEKEPVEKGPSGPLDGKILIASSWPLEPVAYIAVAIKWLPIPKSKEPVDNNSRPVSVLP